MSYPSLVNALERRVQLTSLPRIINIARSTETHLRDVRGEPFRRAIDPEQVNGHHEDDRMNSSSSQGGLTGREDTTRSRRQCQEDTRAQDEEQYSQKKVIHRYTLRCYY
jgi:hypothetical protein